MPAYFYKLREKETGRLYAGCQYSQHADPKNLLVTYRTSCRYIRERGCDAFEIMKVIVRADAREFERRYLRRMFYALGRKQFEQVFINRNMAPGVLFTQEVRERMSIALKQAAMKRRENGTLRATFLGRHHTDGTKALISLKAKARIRAQGHPRGMRGKQHTPEVKEQIRQTSAQNSAMKGLTGDKHPTGGTVWWNNGHSHKRSVTCPGDGWAQGRLFKERAKKQADN